MKNKTKAFGNNAKDETGKKDLPKFYIHQMKISSTKAINRKNLK